MSKIAIVTDSTANIPAEYLRNYPIFSLPLLLIWEEKTYKEGVDIQAEEFYDRLQTCTAMPSTSQVTPHAFKTLYEKLLNEGYEILSMHISSQLSGTLASATQAKNEFPGAPIVLFDSESASMGLGFQVLAAAKAAATGASMQECLRKAELARVNSNAMFVVNTLEFLHRGGRIGGAAAFFGNAFNLKPILGLEDGKISALDKVRTKSKAMQRLIELFDQKLQNRTHVRVACLHANAPVEAQILLDRLIEKYGSERIIETMLTEVSPVIGTHTGPGTVGLAFLVEN